MATLLKSPTTFLAAATLLVGTLLSPVNAAATQARTFSKGALREISDATRVGIGRHGVEVRERIGDSDAVGCESAFGIPEYVSGNPTRYTDPDGRCERREDGTIDCISDNARTTSALAQETADFYNGGEYLPALAGAVLTGVNAVVFGTASHALQAVVGPGNASYVGTTAAAKGDYKTAAVKTAETALLIATAGTGSEAPLVRNVLPTKAIDQGIRQAFAELSAESESAVAASMRPRPAPALSPASEAAVLGEVAGRPGEVWVNPEGLRYSQRTAGGGDPPRAPDLREKLASGWDPAKGPVDLIESEAGLVTFDNTRVAVAQELQIPQISARIHPANEPLPSGFAVERGLLGRADKLKLPAPTTWGEALHVRTASNRLPPSGRPERPSMPE